MEKDQVIESDYIKHPAELVPGGVIDTKYTVADLRNAIPAYCFKPRLSLSLWYLLRDLAVATTLLYVAATYITTIEPRVLRYTLWLAYGYIQGQQLTGIWVLGHECGHGNFSSSQPINDTIGFILHSALLTPYFSWKSTHRRHHIYANNLAKDHNYVPPTRTTYANLIGFDTEHLEELTEDSPFVTLLRIVLQQLIGFPWYLLTNITASQGSLAAGKADQGPSRWALGNSHFLPHSTIFRPEEAPFILLSDIGVAITMAGLWFASSVVGWQAVTLLYIQPYMWVNHWIVMITYLHHTHPDIPKYEPEAWTFLKGATATIDRNFGFAGKHFFHNISDFHVIHHLFSHIPQYYAEEATRAIQPLLGDSYRCDKHSNIWCGIWEAFTKCQWVEPLDSTAKPEDRVMMYHGGPSPVVECNMGRGGR